MKKFLSVVLTLTLVTSVFSMLSVDASAEEELFRFFEVEDGYKLQYCITSAEGAVVLPEEYMGKPVVAIQAKAFLNCTKITSVVLPESVTVIDEGAFYNCSLLESVNIPAGVTRIEKDTFSGCGSLKEIELHENIEYIGQEAFYNCTSLESIKIPEKVKEIFGSTFEGCKNLKNVKFSTGISAIGNYAFKNCESLTNIELPTDIVNIGMESFINTAMYNNKANWIDGVFYIGNHLICADRYDVPAFYTVRDGTIDIADSAFYRNLSVKHLTIPQSVQQLKTSVFWECKNLNILNLDGFVGSVGGHSFIETNISAVYVNSVEDWLKIDFQNEYANPLNNGAKLYVANSVVNDAVIPESAEAIKPFTFYNYDYLTSVSIPETIEEIGDFSFFGCSALVNITIPGSVQKIGEYAFCSCDSLKSATLLEGVQQMSKGVFSNCSSLQKITLSSTLEEIDYDVFYNNNSLSSVYINDIKGWVSCKFVSEQSNPLYFAEELYLNNELLTDIVLPETIEKIGDYAFANYKKLSSIVIPESVSHIGTSAFSNCESLNNVTVYGTNANLNYEQFNGSGYFLNAENREKGALYIGDYLVHYKPSVTGAFTIKEGTKVVSDYAFSNCRAITSLEMPDTVEKICTGAFFACGSLESVKFSENLKVIESSAFSFCDRLKKAVLPESLEYLGELSFCCCDALEYVYIPDSVTIINADMFLSSVNLKTVVLPKDLQKIEMGAFDVCDALENVFYNNTEESWSNVVVAECNDNLFSAKFHFNLASHASIEYTVEHPSPDSDGKRSQVCSVCGYEYSENLAYLNEYASNLKTENVRIENQNIIMEKCLLSDINEILEAQEGYKIDFSHNGNIYLGTGSKIKILDESNNTINEYTLVISGDLNGDSVCDTLDCMLMQLHFGNSEILKDEFLLASDMDDNDASDVNDFQSIVNKMLSSVGSAESENL